MKTVFQWIKKHRMISLFILFLLFIFPLIVVHLLFRIDGSNSWLEAKWEAGDVLAYIAGFEAFIGTVMLGAISVYQSELSQEENKRLSEVNIYLQKISVQRLLPLIKIVSLDVSDSAETTNKTTTKENTVVVSESVTPENRSYQILAHIKTERNDGNYSKEIRLTLENISDGIIRQIAIDRIQFSRFKIGNEEVDSSVCCGNKYKYISDLLLPHETLNVTIIIHYNDLRYKRFWDYHDSLSIGAFDISLYLTNTSLSGVDCKELIYIEKGVGFTEKIMYKTFEEDTANA